MHDSKRFNRFAVILLLALTLSGCSGGGESLPKLPKLTGLPITPAAPYQVPIDTSSTNLSLPDTPAEMALSADSLPGDHDADNNFIDSIGINTKLNFATSVYSNYPAVKAALLDLGIRHIRDSFSTQNLNNYESNLTDLANNGIHSVLGLTIAADASNRAKVDITGAQAAAYLQAGHYAASIEAVEGLNEPSVNQADPNGPPPAGWAALTVAEQKALYNGIQALKAPAKRIPVYGPSVATNAARLQQVGDLSRYMDYGNVHDYSGGYDLPGRVIASVLSLEEILSGTKPVVATENGYSTGTTGEGMPDLILLDYAQRLFFKQFAHHIKRTSWYELLDETATPNDYWHNSGLLTSNLVPKVPYFGLKSLILLLKDQTPYKTRTALQFSFGQTRQFENIEHLLLQKNDGSFWLVVWRDVSEWSPAANGSPGSYPDPTPATVPNTLNFFGTYVSSLTQYEEDYSGAMRGTPVALSAGSSAQISIGARPKIFKIVPSSAPRAPLAPALPHPAAHWALNEGSGFVAADSVNAAGNMTIPSNSGVSWLAGRYNAGLGFDGTQASTNATFIDTTQSYSATAWVQLNSLRGYQAAVAVDGVNQAAFALDFTPQSNLSYTTYVADSAATNPTRIGSAFVPVIGRWYAVAATYNARTHSMSLYVDGVLQRRATAKAVFRATGGTELGSVRQGGLGHWQWWNGGVDEVNLYQRELSAADVRIMAGLE